MRRWLNISRAEWDAMTWDTQQTYLDGLSAEEDIPFSIAADTSRPQEPEAATGTDGPTVRRGVNTGASVIDLGAMIADLEANPAARRQQ